jgi:hypothetical protein
MSPPMNDVPWELLAYVAVGVPIAWWYLSRDDHPERDHGFRARGLVVMVLASLWPVLLLAILANPPDKPRKKNDELRK